MIWSVEWFGGGCIFFSALADKPFVELSSGDGCGWAGNFDFGFGVHGGGKFGEDGQGAMYFLCISEEGTNVAGVIGFYVIHVRYTSFVFWGEWSG